MQVIKEKSEEKEERRFYALEYDRVFKAVLLNGEDFTFLNRLISDILNEEIKIKGINCYELPVVNVLVKVNVLDVLLETETGEIINLEINLNFNKIIQERNLVYYMSAFNQRYKRNNVKDPNVRQINLNFHNSLVGEEQEKMMITKLGTKEIYNEEFTFINVNLALVKKVWYDKLRRGHVEHLEMILLACKTKEELEKVSKYGDEVIRKVVKKIMEMNENLKITPLMDGEEEARMLSERSLQYALESGIEEGEERKAINVAELLLKKGMSINEIVEITKLTKDKVIELEENLPSSKKLKKAKK